MFPDLYLHGTVWDEDRHILSAIDSSTCSTDNVSSVELYTENTRYSAVVTASLVNARHHGLLLEGTNSPSPSVFHCPVIGASLRDESEGDHSHCPPLFYVPLPCVMQDLNSTSCAWSKVYLCCNVQGNL